MCCLPSKRGTRTITFESRTFTGLMRSTPLTLQVQPILTPGRYVIRAHLVPKRDVAFMPYDRRRHRVPLEGQDAPAALPLSSGT
jgi:hypothetical protein